MIPWQTVEKQLQDHRRDAGWKGGPCLRIRLKTGESYLIHRVMEWSESCLTALAYLPAETLDESVARFTFLAVDPGEVYLYEAFEPEPRGPDQLKRLTISPRERTERKTVVEKK